MNRGKGKSKSTLGDSASDFMEQWKASKPDGPPPADDSGRGTAVSRENRDVDQSLRAWRRDGAEVKVTKGASVHSGKRWKKPSEPGPHRKPDMPITGARFGNPAPSRITQHQSVPFPAPVLTPAPPRIPRIAPAPIPKNLRQRLREASADVRDLRISAAMSRPRRFADLSPVIEDKEGKLAILGLDFGTAFTKAVVRWSGRHYAVDWSDAVEGEDHHLLASVFSERSDGRCSLGVHEGSEWSVREGIKLRMLSSGVRATEAHMADAVIFIALVFRYVDGWLNGTNQEAARGIRWRLHVGLPTRSWDSNATAEAFKTVSQAARVLACMPGPVTRAAALQALQMTERVDRPAVDVFPEFACQLYSYLLSSERREDLHALVDIGAGTLDVAYFNVFMKDGEALLPIFASEVERLGAHYLIAALSGAEGRPDWSDDESSLSDDEVGQKLDCPPSAVSSRRSLYLSSVASVFNGATCRAKVMYPNSPAFQSAEHVRLFLCGGGSRIPSLQKRFKRIAKEAENILGIKFQVSELVTPRDIVGSVDAGFDRLSVAYGLSQNAANIGSVMRSATLDQVMPRERLDDRHRDDDR